MQVSRHIVKLKILESLAYFLDICIPQIVAINSQLQMKFFMIFDLIVLYFI